MLKYNDFLLEAQLVKIEQDFINESFDSVNNAIEKFLDKEFTVDSGRFEEIVLNLLNRFKGKLKIVTIIVSLLLSSYMGIDKVKSLLSNAGFDKQKQEQIISNVETNTPNKVSKIKKHVVKGKSEIRKFLHALADRESSSDAESINSLGYIGKYQFGKMALKDLGLDDTINTRKFKENPSIFPEHAQDKAMVQLLKINKGYLGDYIDDYTGKTIAGVSITPSGLLAGSHLVGAGAIKTFLDSNGKIIPKDGNGVPVTEYIKKFGGYNLTF